MLNGTDDHPAHLQTKNENGAVYCTFYPISGFVSFPANIFHRGAATRSGELKIGFFYKRKTSNLIYNPVAVC